MAQKYDGNYTECAHSRAEHEDVAPAGFCEIASDHGPHAVPNAIEYLEDTCIDSLLLQRNLISENEHWYIGHPSGSNTLKSTAKKQNCPGRSDRAENAADGEGDNRELEGEIASKNVGNLADDGDESTGRKCKGCDDPVELIEFVCGDMLADVHLWDECKTLLKCEAMDGRAVATTVKSRLATKKPGSSKSKSFHLYLRAALFSAAHVPHLPP